MKLAIIDNHGMFMDGFVSSLEKFTEVEKIFSFFPEEMEKINECIEQHSVDLIIIDINLDGLSGFDIAEQIKAKNARLPLAFVTGHGNQASLRNDALEFGAAGFFLKDPKPREFLIQIKEAITGEKPGLDEIMQLPRLTSREKEVLHYLCKGYTNQELADQLFISMRQIERHKRNMMLKFNVSNDKTLVRKAINLGYEIIN